jgi:1-pyrroline-5-carboxylate dehydrogenase
MTAIPSTRPKITYATAQIDNEQLDLEYEAGLAAIRATLGEHLQNVVGGREVDSAQSSAKQSPIDGAQLGTFALATELDVHAAVGAARSAFPAWSRRPWQERVAILRRAADLLGERQMQLAGLLSLEVGKNRLEAIGDVEETIDLIRWSCRMVEQSDGFDRPMGNLGDATVHTRSVLRPFGVWAVISPFNFPFALAGGPAGAALVAGNTVVFKPSSDAPLSAAHLTRVMRDAGVPDGVFNLVMGPGETVGAALVDDPDVGGVVFTGSFEVGFGLYKRFARTYPKPMIAEMGGKSPSIVARTADLDEAAEGILRSAFAFGAQKCAANSRIFVERSVHDDFVRRLVEKTEKITIGDPTRRENWLGPLISARSVGRYETAVAEARRDGRVYIGGERLSDAGLESGYFVEPTIVGGLSHEHRLLRDELFVPFTAVVPVDSVDQALDFANDHILGLTAGIYSEDKSEIDEFLARIEAGVVYVNRRAGSTTGAWAGAQPFGGWKGSTATGRGSGGYYYVQQFMREQSRTIVD